MCITCVFQSTTTPPHCATMSTKVMGGILPGEKSAAKKNGEITSKRVVRESPRFREFDFFRKPAVDSGMDLGPRLGTIQVVYHP